MFSSVSEDSRLPTGFFCLWADTARTRQHFREMERSRVFADLNSYPDPKEVSYPPFTNTLVRVASPPSAHATNAPRTFAATLLISKPQGLG